MCLTWGGRPAHSCRRLAIQRDTYPGERHGIPWHGPSFFVVDIWCVVVVRGKKMTGRPLKNSLKFENIYLSLQI